MTGILDANAISKIGNVTGVQALVLGSYHIKTKKDTVTTRTFRKGVRRRVRPAGTARSVTTVRSVYDAISIRMVDAATGEILFSAASTENISEENMDEFLKKLSDEIVKAFAK
jgi:curli biogenesis system outer membrane secretion channel CsgG